MAWQFSASRLDLVTLAFTMTSYTYGPMLGIFLLSIVAPRYRIEHLGLSVAFSVVVVLLLNEPEILNTLFGTGFDGPLLAWPWLFPIGTLCCMLGAFRGRRT